MFYEREKLKYLKKNLNSNKSIFYWQIITKYILDLPQVNKNLDDLQWKMSNLNFNQDKFLVYDDKKTIRIFSLKEKKWEFTYVFTIPKLYKILNYS